MQLREVPIGSWFYLEQRGQFLKLPPYIPQYLSNNPTDAIDESGKTWVIDGSTEVQIISFFTARDLKEGDRFIIWPVATPGHMVIGEKPFAIYTWVNGTAFNPDEDGLSSRQFIINPRERVVRVG